MKALIGNFSIKQTVVLAVATGLVVAILSIVVGLDTNARVNHLIGHIDEYTHTTAAKRDLLGELESNLGYGGAIHTFKNAVLRGKTKYIERFREKSNSALAAIAAYRKQQVTEEEAAHLAAIEAVVRKYMVQGQTVQRLIEAGKTPDEIDAAVKVNDQPALAAISALGETLIADRNTYQQELAKDLDALRQMAFIEALASPIALLLLTVLMVIALFHIRRVIGGEPQTVEQITRRVAEGELSIADEFQGKNTSGILDSTLRSVASTATVVHRTRDIATTVDTSVDGIMEKVEELRERFVNQQGNIKNTAKTMWQMTEITHKNAASADLANQLSTEATQSSLQGSEVVKQAIDAMDQINTASERIADIITVIDEIAFQTNLLALNAAVEAARAGDHGKGFAVVAAEVRNLAQRSATAAKEIEGLIEDSTSKVNDGTVLVNAAGEALKEIYDSVEKVNEVVAQMASSNKQQATGIDEVNAAVGRIEKVRAANEKQVLQIAADCDLLDRQAAELMKTIGFFRTGETSMLGQTLASSTPAGSDFQQEIGAAAWESPEPFADLDEPPYEATKTQADTSNNSWNGKERRSATRPWNHRVSAAPSSQTSDSHDWDSF